MRYEHAGKPIRWWGFDSEFNIDEKVVYSIQFYSSDGLEIYVRNAADLHAFFREYKPSLIFGYKIDNDIGSIELMSGDTLTKRMQGNQEIAWYRGAMFRDLKPFASAMGLHRLADIGDYIGCFKLDSEVVLHNQNPDSSEFKTYAMRDAEICYRFVKHIMEALEFPHPKAITTPSGYAQRKMGMPDNYPHSKLTGKLIIPQEHRDIRWLSTFAGRSECFINGYLENYCYLDICSQYPTAALSSNALNIRGIRGCDPKNINLREREWYDDYGWILGTFYTDNDEWGIPKRIPLNPQYKQVRYVNGKVHGLFHSLDLLASDAKIVNIEKAWKPVYQEHPYVNKFEELYWKKMNKNYANQNEKEIVKLCLNGMLGKLAQIHPVPATFCNFPAYNTVVAASHLIFSNILKLTQKGHIAAMDTDSLFLPSNYEAMRGYVFNIDKYPVNLDIKHPSDDILIFRAKQYLFKHKIDSHDKHYASHGWRYKTKEFSDLWNNLKDEHIKLKVIKEVRHTMNTKEKEALEKPYGWWGCKEFEKDENDLIPLLKADSKRYREEENSWLLCREKERGYSQAHIMYS
jgi:hypothetical protein